MERSETRRKSVPGARELIIQIKQISNDIGTIDTEIKQCQDKIHSIIITEKSNSPRAKLSAELREASDAKGMLLKEKSGYTAIINDAKSRIESLRNAMQTSGSGFNSIEKIDKALEDLELRLISTSISAKEESDIANNMANLKSQKNKLSEMENNFKTIETLNATIKENRTKIAELIEELDKKNEIITKLKAELEKLSEGGKNKSPEITKLENKIADLKNQKTECMKQRDSKRSEVHALEEEYSKFEAELLVQKALESQKDEIRNMIEDLKSKKDSLVTQLDAFDPKIYDSLMFVINQARKSKNLSLSVDLVSHLIKNGIPIPRTVAELDQTIEVLDKKKAGCASEFKAKKEKVCALISEIDSKIAAENEKLAALPQTNFDILKKGGFRTGFRNK